MITDKKDIANFEKAFDSFSDDFGDDWRAKANYLASTSDKQCNDCIMMRNECVKWGYSREGAVGERNMAPFCQFYMHKKEGETLRTCPLCGGEWKPYE